MPATLSVFFNVQDVSRSLQFYKGLGFKVTHAADGDDGHVYYADLSYQGAEIGLGHIPANDDPEFVQWVSTPLGAGVLVYISTRNVDRIHEKAQAIGATIEHPPQDRFYGRVLTLNDPDGYTLTFIDESKTQRAKKAAPKKSAAKKTAPKKAAKKGAAKAVPKRASAKRGPAKKAAAKKAAPARKRTPARRRS